MTDLPFEIDNFQQPEEHAYTAKLKHIVPTFLIVVFSTVIGLAIVRSLFCIQFSRLDIKEDIWVLWIPIVFPWIPITLWLRQRFIVLTVSNITDGTYSAVASSIYVNGTDVYVAGAQYAYGGGAAARLWKNGSPKFEHYEPIFSGEVCVL